MANRAFHLRSGARSAERPSAPRFVWNESFTRSGAANDPFASTLRLDLNRRALV
jgi:hypothetical protein